MGPDQTELWFLTLAASAKTDIAREPTPVILINGFEAGLGHCRVKIPPGDSNGNHSWGTWRDLF